MRPKFFFLPILFPFFLIIVLLPLFILTFVLFAGITVGTLLGFSPEETLFLFFMIVLGSFINIPVLERESRKVKYVRDPFFSRFYRVPQVEKTVIAVNLGGCIIPFFISMYIISSIPVKPWLIATGIITLSTYHTARPIRNTGIAVPVLLPPLISVLSSYISLIMYGYPVYLLPKLSFSAGVIGVILGADVLHLRDIEKIGAGYISIGGAGTFDGIFLTGIFSVILSVFLLPV